ncbi:MAG: biotin/lipoyl-containing protein [Cyclobacteriaceae bacterium]
MGLVKLNNQSLNVVHNANGWWVNGREMKLEIKPLGEGRYLVFHNHRVHQIEVLSPNSQGHLTLSINQKTCHAEIIGERERLLEKLGWQKEVGQEIKDLVAPMPGLILEIKVKPGDKVEKNDILLVLEAMKMENTIKSPQSGTVSAVKVKQGEGVEKNQLLIQF